MIMGITLFAGTLVILGNLIALMSATACSTRGFGWSEWKPYLRAAFASDIRSRLVSSVQSAPETATGEATSKAGHSAFEMSSKPRTISAWPGGSRRNKMAMIGLTFVILMIIIAIWRPDS